MIAVKWRNVVVLRGSNDKARVDQNVDVFWLTWLLLLMVEGKHVFGLHGGRCTLAKYISRGGQLQDPDVELVKHSHLLIVKHIVNLQVFDVLDLSFCLIVHTIKLLMLQGTQRAKGSVSDTQR
jgi:hypothetical protein